MRKVARLMQKYWRFLRVKLIRNTKPDADYDFEWVKHEKFTINGLLKVVADQTHATKGIASFLTICSSHVIMMFV